MSSDLETLQIRRATPKDLDATAELYAAAFPDEDLVPLIRQLAQDPAVDILLAESGGQVIGHIAFTSCNITPGNHAAALLGPLAVAPVRQAKGIGSKLVRHGLERMGRQAVPVVFVLGAPGFYGRFGFTADATVAPPHSLPPQWIDAWQSITLRPIASTLHGKLQVPPPWQPAALWRP